jgi:hypothetical protein
MGRLQDEAPVLAGAFFSFYSIALGKLLRQGDPLGRSGVLPLGLVWQIQ